MDLNLVSEGDEILHMPAKDWDFEHPPYDARELLDAMFRIMDINGGVGLAAPQVGVPYRLFVTKYTGYKSFFNPVLAALGTETHKQYEGCLSFPLLSLEIERPISVRMSYQDEIGVRLESVYHGFEARLYCHETDHTNGICFIRHVDREILKSKIIERDAYLSKLIYNISKYNSV